MKHALITLREERRALAAQYGAIVNWPLTEESARLRDQTAREVAQVQEALDYLGEMMLFDERAA